MTYSIFIYCRPLTTRGSYMDVPRLHFAGHFRADPNTRNNINCNYDLDNSIDPNLGRDYNYNGTGEFSFIDCKVTSVTYENGTHSTTDPIVNSPIVNNDNVTFPKLVDLDVDFQLIKATIYGMVFGINWESDDETQQTAFKGDWEPNVIAQNLWSRAICIDINLTNESHRYGSHSATILRNVAWGDVSKSPALQQLKFATERTGNVPKQLSVSMTLYFYTRNIPEYVFTNFTLGYVVGSIGISKENEPDNFGGNRLLSFEDVGQTYISLDETDSCYQYQHSGKNYPHWMYKAPFQVDDHNSMLTVDLSNSIPQHLDGRMRNIGDLYIGILDEFENCVEIVGKQVPYMDDKTWLGNTGGVLDYNLTEHQLGLLQYSKLVVVRAEKRYHWHEDQLKTAPAPLQFYVRCSVDDEYTYKVTLQEMEYFVRPMSYYVQRLSDPSEPYEVRFLVSRFGKPVRDQPVHVYQSNDVVLPKQGVQPSKSTNNTNNDGIASFTFKITKNIPSPRVYETPQQPCDKTLLPIDGQVYTFSYNVSGMCVGDLQNSVSYMSCSNDIAILAFSHFDIPETPTWEDVAPIFKQYDRLTPVMHQMIKLSNCEVVVSHRDLIAMAMSLDFKHPSYMPATRDLSPKKQRMILKWLKNPTCPRAGDHRPDEIRDCEPPPTLAAVSYISEYFKPPRCQKKLSFGEPPEADDLYFSQISDSHPGLWYDMDGFKKGPRPLWRINVRGDADIALANKCTLHHLKKQLQLAVELEFATLPVYLTSLYSIVDGCNKEIYDLIRSVIMQEMFHLIQAANILIAVNGSPIIDSKEAIPSYPTIGLPGGVLPKLRVTLEKLSLIHVYEVFMGIEVPHNTSVDTDNPKNFNDTIGQFYKEIESCIIHLGDDIFIGNPERQIPWPWESSDVGHMYKVTNVSSAINAINEIIEQGEGASPIDPTYNNTGKLAHFYKFEEIVCQKHLILVNDTDNPHYVYDGANITFIPQGVWPMRPSPSINCIPPDNNCYTEAKAFHGAFRALLKKLQRIFNGTDDPLTEIRESLTNMESLRVHAQKLMWTKVGPHDDITCGPVWDYEWDD